MDLYKVLHRVLNSIGKVSREIPIWSIFLKWGFEYSLFDIDSSGSEDLDSFPYLKHAIELWPGVW